MKRRKFMKIKKLSFLVLASMAMGALIGCGNQPTPEPEPPEPEPLPAEYSLMKYWAGNEAEEFYSVQENDNSTVITYTDVTGEDAGGWAYVRRSFAYDSANIARFSEYKKVVFEGKLQKSSGSDIVMVKVEGSDGNQWEKRFTFAAEVKTYEFSLSFISDWSKVTQILFFANRSTNLSGNGVITLNKMALSKADVVAANDIAPGQPTVPQGHAIYNGLAENQNELAIDYHWGYASDGGIKTETVNGEYKFSWGGDLQKGSEYEWVSSKIKNGSAKLQESGLKRVVFEVTGTADQEAIFKFESEQSHAQKEVRVTLTGAKQEVEVDITPALANADDTSWMAMIMPAPGQRGQVAAGTLTLHKCKLDKTEVYVPVNVVKFPQAWLDVVYAKDAEYEVAADPEVAHKQVITYNVANTPNFSSVKYMAKLNDDWFGAANYRRIVGKFTADVDVQVLIKPFDKGANEKWLNLKAGEAQFVDYDLEEANVDLSKPIFVMIATSEGSTKTGHVQIEDFRLARVTANVEDVNGVVRLNRVNNKAAYEYAVNKQGDLEVTWNFTENKYEFMELTVSAANAAKLAKLLGTLVSTADVHVGLKPADNGANEEKVALTAGTPVDVEKAIAADARLNDEWVGKVIVFIGYETGDALTGKVTFKNFRLTDGEHDTTYLPLPAGKYFASQALKAAAGGGQVEILLEVGADESVALRIANTVYPATLVSYNKVTGVIKFNATGLGAFGGKYNPTTKALDNCGLEGDMGAALEYNNYFSMTSHFKFWDCEGTSDELKAQFNRRYGDPWTKDTGNADRFASVEQGINGKAMSVRPYKGNRYSFSPVDFAEAFECKNLSFWVYNPGEQDVTLKAWGYKAVNWGTNFQIGNEFTAKHGTWTYISCGFTKASIYSFQIAEFSSKGFRLVYDDICIF